MYNELCKNKLNSKKKQVFLACNFLLIGEKKNGFYELSLDEDARAERIQTSKKKG